MIILYIQSLYFIFIQDGITIHNVQKSTTGRAAVATMLRPALYYEVRKEESINLYFNNSLHFDGRTKLSWIHLLLRFIIPRGLTQCHSVIGRFVIYRLGVNIFGVPSSLFVPPAILVVCSRKRGD